MALAGRSNWGIGLEADWGIGLGIDLETGFDAGLEIGLEIGSEIDSEMGRPLVDRIGDKLGPVSRPYYRNLGTEMLSFLIDLQFYGDNENILINALDFS